MNWEYYPPIIPIFIALIISGALAVWGWHRRPAPGAAWFGALMFSSFLFTLFYGLEILSNDLRSVIFWSQMQYLGALNISIMWLFLVLTYTGKRDWLTARNIGLVFVIPAITLVLVWTNRYHELIWIDPTLKSTPYFSVLGFTPGVWWLINIVYANILFIVATFQLVSALIRSDSVYRQQVIILLAFSVINWAGTGIYVLGLTPYGTNPSPITFSVGGLLIAWGLFRYHIIDIAPIARDKIINDMLEGLIVLDAQNRIVDINPMAQKILDCPQAGTIGKPIHEVLSAHPELEAQLCHDENDSDQPVEITFPIREMGLRSFDVRVSVLKDKRGRTTGRLMFWHDISERAKQETATNLLLSITQEVSMAKSFRSSINKALEIIVEHTGWAFGEAWLPNEDHSALENANASYCHGSHLKPLQDFNTISQEFTFRPNMGLPGRVWVSKEIEWQRNISTLPQEIYLRVQYAKKAKLKTSLGIPVLEKGEVIVVLVFYMTDEARTEDQYLIDLVSAATAQLGAVLQSKRAEEVMRIQSAALEASPNGIVITDSAGRITWANPAFAQLTGYSMQEIRGENPRVLKSGQHSRDFYTGIWQKILSGESWQGEIVNRRKDGSLYTEEQSITPVRNSDGEITHFIAIKQDITQRKQAEEKIQQQNTFLNNVIESIASPFYVINTADYSIEIANSAARALGVDRLNTCFALTHGRETPCDGQEHPCPLKVVQETKRPITVEHTHFTAEGELIWVEVHGYPILNESGDVLQMIEYTLDITARKMAEKALQESQAELERSEARYRLLADNSTDVIWTMGLDMRFTYISPSVRLHRGYTVDEAMSLSLEETLPPDSFQKVVSIMTNALADIKKLPLEERPMAAQTVEMENYCKDGSTMWVEATISFLLDPDGDPVGVLGVSRDITKRKQAEDELRKLSRAVEQSGSTIVVTDLEGNIEFANPAFTRITGYTLDEIIGVNTRILSSGKHPPEFYQDLWGTITRGDVWHGEMINRKKNGELYWESATISPVQTPDGKTTHYLAIKEDITERKAIEAALLQEQEKTDALLKNILPATVAEEIKRTGSVTPVLFENVSILFTDFTDFTTMAEEIPPQELVKLIDHYFSFFDFIVKKYNLEKLKTIGDSYMCAGGLPTPSARHAVDITYAALDFMNFVQLEKEERQRQGLPYWDMRIGISSGPVVAGIVGHIKYNYDVWGDTVVMAARMEQSGKPGRVNISKTTYDLIKDHFDCQYRGTVRAKHKGLVEMYFVNGPLSR